MKKIGLVIDSHVGLSESETNKRGMGFIPLNIFLGDKSYLSGINITSEEIETAQLANNKLKVSTSSPTGANIEKGYDWALARYEKVVVLSLSHKFSGTNNALKVMANDPKYKGKVFVYNSLYCSPWSTLLIDDILEIVENATSVKRIFELWDQQNGIQEGYLSPENIYWFYNGGRITKMQYIAGSIMKIFPILTVKNGFIDQSGVVKIRTKKRAFKTIAQMTKELKEKYDRMDLKYDFGVLISNDKESNEVALNTLANEFGVKIKNIKTTRLGPEQVTHMGPNGFGMCLIAKFKEKK